MWFQTLLKFLHMNIKWLKNRKIHSIISQFAYSIEQTCVFFLVMETIVLNVPVTASFVKTTLGLGMATWVQSGVSISHHHQKCKAFLLKVQRRPLGIWTEPTTFCQKYTSPTCVTVWQHCIMTLVSVGTACCSGWPVCMKPAQGKACGVYWNQDWLFKMVDGQKKDLWTACCP